MKNLQEIETRMSEIKAELENPEADLEALDKELDELVEERKALNEKAEQRKNTLEKIARGEEGKEIEKMNEENKKEVRKFDVSSAEYRTAWAKTLMGRKDLTTDETRALGDAVTTTASTFVEADETHVGVNNGGLLIPTSVRTDILGLIEKQSPFYRDIKKLAVAGNIDLPFMDSSDDANWVVEGTDTKNEGIEFKKIQLTGYELAKNVVVTWKLEAMAVADFISFITAEIANKMGKAICTAVIYGDGSGEPTGAIYGLTAVEGTDPINTIVEAYKSLADDFRIGAKAYISTDANIEIVGYKDGNDNYPYLNGVSATKLVNIEVDPYLADGDMIVGNPANYIFNTVEALSVARESHVVGRKTTYGSYGIFDGKPRTGAFVKGSYVASTSL